MKSVSVFQKAAYPVTLKNVSKVYRLYSRPVDRIREILFRKTLHRNFWALRDVNLVLRKSETFGVVGENGAGKSTLLKIVAGTTRPSSGSVEVRGMVSALLELGAAFHPELSGRENIFMQAAILGLSEREIRARYSEIAEFSELDDAILERPVKTYSSGMFVRLGFAIATCVEPDVLVVDEALSVGDIHFQKKSLDRIMGFREAGRTIMFCSHNMYQVRTLCQRAMWLKNGRVEAFGETEDVVSAYEAYQRKKEGSLRQDNGAENIPVENKALSAAGQPAPVKITRIEILDARGRAVNRLLSHRDAAVKISVDVLDTDVPFHVAVVIQRDDGINIFFTTTMQQGLEPVIGLGKVNALLEIPGFPILSGEYSLFVYLLDDHGIQVLDMAEGVCRFSVRSDPSEMGIVALEHHWHIEES